VVADKPALANFSGSGFTGVSLFFCLSGFIMLIVYEHLRRDRTALMCFFLARVARVYTDFHGL
jgi:peptidoglycan/LPS O-acetylase OafA/YrhL